MEDASCADHMKGFLVTTGNYVRYQDVMQVIDWMKLESASDAIVVMKPPKTEGAASKL